MIDSETGVVHFNRYSKGKMHGQCVRIWDDGKKWISNLSDDHQVHQLTYDANGKRTGVREKGRGSSQHM